MTPFAHVSKEILMVPNFLEALRIACRSVTDDAVKPLWSRFRSIPMKYRWFEIAKKSLGSLQKAAVEPFAHF